ncbi:MAG TPA: potassium-transporting ATPase subunit KdpB [Gammaproteobacteria bacterium]|nr:potassium-transporting ATPase subunit KdpB [Gammaproteobacteria bacterium]
MATDITSTRRVTKQSLLNRKIAMHALRRAIVMLRPDLMWRNPVMFVVEVGTALTFIYIVQMLMRGHHNNASINYLITLGVWLFLTILFANFATALAEAHGKAQADSLRHTRQETIAFRLLHNGSVEEISSSELNRGDHVLVQAGQIIPGDGEIIEGIAYIDESVITGESAPVVREEGGDRSGVTGGTKVLSDRIVVRISGSKGDSFLDKMIALVEGAIRHRTPNELALTIILSAFTLIFLIVVVPIWSMSFNAELYMANYLGVPHVLPSLGTDVPTLIALLVCLIPTTIGALLSAIGIAGMDRALQANIIANSGKAVELAGDIDVVLLDKTGTITVGDRNAVQFVSMNNYTEQDLGTFAALASLSDHTPEGKSIVSLYTKRFQGALSTPEGSVSKAFTAQSRMSGVDLPTGQSIRKGAPDAIIKLVQSKGGKIPDDINATINRVASKGATPMLVAEGGNIVGMVVLEDILKPLISERFARLRRMGLRTVMITGDNPLTAAAIAAAAGVDDYIAEATPAIKLDFIKQQQAEGKLVAMMGDGTNDAPALAQADVGIAMNAGTDAAKEAANMVDLDSDPVKLIEVIEIGKQLLITRGALTTFSVANDVAKYFAIIPALFATNLPWLGAMDVMHLHSPTSAILSAVIFNALIIPALIPIALRGIRYRALGADALLRRNLLIWGGGGVIAPFIGIKVIDTIMVTLNFVS